MKYLKAVFAGVFSGLGLTQTAYIAGNGHIGFVAIISIVLAALGTAAATWGVPNAEKAPAAPTP